MRGIRALAVAIALTVQASGAAAQQMIVNKTPDCGCCAAWAQAMEEAGFEVTVRNVDQSALNGLKSLIGITPALASCHTAVVGGYVVEGHVPPEDIRRLLDEYPDAIGLAVPGMPVGSTGMEMPGRSEPYDVMLVTEPGVAEKYSHHD